MNYPNKARQIVLYIFAIILSASFLFVWQNAARSQTNADVIQADVSKREVTVHVPERGGKHVNFFDGQEVRTGPNASGNQPVALVSADFDSDGIADIVTADSGGGLQLLKGIDPANYALDPSGQKRAEPDPFSSFSIESSLGISPDLMFSGDFNADGKQDILAASKGSRNLVLLSGNGSGQFTVPQSIGVDGTITAAEAGEIGLRDGQTDLALAVTNEGGSFIYIYEHPESAFKHRPEIIRLPAPPTALTIGNTDEDFYSDIAVACGSSLVIIHERGQAYPWDIVKDSFITRPPAIVDVRKMPFSISSLAIGRFGEKRGTSLALLSSDGNIHRLEPSRKFAASNIKLPAGRLVQSQGMPFAPTDVDVSKYLLPIESNIVASPTDAAGKPLIDQKAIRGIGREEHLQKQSEEFGKSTNRYTPEEIARQTAEMQAKRPEMEARQKAAFLRSISAKTSLIKDWKLETVAAGSQFSAVAASGEAQLMRVNVSDSNLDDLMVSAKGSGEIRFVSRLKNDEETLRSEVSSVVANSGALAVLPVRLNLDGLNDLMILQDGATSPSVVMSAPSAVFFVNTTNDTFTCVANGEGECSLRGAIIEANANPGNDIVGFALPLGTVISPTSPLPSINSTVSIQSGNIGNGPRGIEISGVNAGPSVDGLKIRASNVFIYSVAVSGFQSTIVGGGQVGGNGIVIASDSGAPNIGSNNVWDCYLGTDATGNIDRGNDATGVLIFDSDNNGIVGSLISGNGSETKVGYGIGVTAGNSNSFTRNIIGLNAAGTAKLSNTTGILLTGENNSIGTDFAGEGNTISGNTRPTNFAPCFGYGIDVRVLADATTLELLTFQNSIKGNRIGTNPSGTVGFGNCWQGIQTPPLVATTNGSITDEGRNTVSDNGLGGIACGDPNLAADISEGGYCVIVGNNIGTDITGNFAIPNDIRNIPNVYGSTGAVGVLGNISVSYIGAPGGTTPGGACTGFCNLISGNGGGFTVDAGVITGGLGIVGIFNNYVGTNKEGTQALGNPGGVALYSSIIPDSSQSVYLGGHGTLDGQTVALGNLISGNQQGGISVGTFFTPNLTHYVEYLVAGNLVGTDRSGTAAIPNTGHGIGVGTGPTDMVRIGGSDPLDRNIISGNSADGMFLFSSVNTTIFNNLIGANLSLSPLGNGGNGISISQLYAYSTVVGGAAETANVIANNGGTGVRVNNGFGGGPSYFNSIRGNSIYNNGALGIDLNAGNAFNPPDGVTANDCLDPDSGANGFQNYPSLLSAVQNGGGNAVVTGYLRSQVAEDYDLDFYSNPTPESNNYGEGAVYIGSLRIKTNGSGFRSFQFTSDHPVTNLNITATATDSFGNTSEFSCIAGLCDDPVITIEQAEIVYGTSICADPIVVNVTGDAHDEDLLDQTCDVDGDTSGLQCTLRAAMEEAESQPGTNAITFDIPGGGIHGFLPQTPLPQMNQPVSIDATTQPGYAGTPLIAIDGQNTTNAYGIQLSGGQSVVRGLSIVNFKEQIGLGTNKGQNRITANFIGIHPTGATGDRMRQQFGIAVVNGSSANRIGSLETQDRNIISGNGVGISINSGSNGNWILNNHIGLAPDGNAGFGNDTGIIIRGSNSNFIGSGVDYGTNVISGSVNDGILLDEGAAQNRIFGNFIGTDITGTISIGNAHGIRVHNAATNNIIGGTRREERNVISGHNATNNSVGVLIDPDAGAGNSVSGNYLGISKEGDLSLPNRVGIAINADNQTIGNANPDDFRNLIVSANTPGAYGIYLHPFFPNDELSNVTVQNNTVGTLSFNNEPSGYIGIFLFENVRNSTIKGNTVGHQSFAGIRLLEGPHNNTISENRVGIKTTNEPIPNFNGIVIKQSDTNFVKDNIVSGNTWHGIVVGDGFGQNDFAPPSKGLKRQSGSSSFAINNVITGNKVGTTNDAFGVVPNGAVGIGIGANGRDNTIGGAGALGNIVGGSTGEFGVGIFIGIIDDSQPENILPQNNKVEGNYVGVGTGANPINLPNDYGIYIRNAVNTTVGGGTPAKGNIVGYNHANGIRLFKPNTIDTTVQNNFVGVLLDGGIIANEGDGISIDGAVSTLLQENRIGGNAGFGIGVTNIPNTTLHRRNRAMLFGSIKLLGNVNGVFKMADGSVIAVPNLLGGLNMTDVYQPILGEVGSLLNNVFAGNNGPGALIERCLGAKINGGYFGTDPTGTVGIGNTGPGIEVTNSTLTEVHQATISGNEEEGLYGHELPDDESGEPTLTVSESNIGVVKTENGAVTAVKNNSDGMKLVDVGKFLIGVQGVLNNRKKNVISANQGNGVTVRSSGLFGGALQSLINHTILGTDESGAGGLGNLQKCVLIDNASNILIGSINSQLRVVMSGCAEAGLKLAGQATSTIRVLNTLFGVSPDGKNGVGNGGDGVLISESAHDNNIGGQGENEGNTIAFNGGAGVRIDETAGPGNNVDPNVLFANQGLGIDIGSHGYTWNDPGDSDEGPNRLQNYPEISNFGVDGNGDLIVSYKVDSEIGPSDYGFNGIYVEFFRADNGNEGMHFFGSNYYTWGDHEGLFASTKTINLGNAAAIGFNVGDRITATATDAGGNTSEFFPAFAPTASGVTISGRVTKAGKEGISKAVLTLTADDGRVRRLLTNGLGYFKFEDIEAGRSYVLTVSQKQLVFENPSRVLMVTDDLTNVDFIASP